MTACARVALSAFALLVALESLDAFHISSPTLLRPRATGRCPSRLRRLELRASSDSDRVGTGNGGVAPDGGHTTRAEQLSTELRKAKTFREAWEARFRGLGVDIAPPAHEDLSPELHALLPQRHVAQHAHLPSPRAPLVSPLRARGRPSDFTSARAGRAAHPARRRNLARRAVALGPDHGRLAPPLEPFTSHLVRARPVPDGPPARRRERCRLRAGAARGQERGELARRREAR